MHLPLQLFLHIDRLCTFGNLKAKYEGGGYYKCINKGEKHFTKIFMNTVLH